MKKVYLDYAAATPLDVKVSKLMHQAETKLYANPSSAHSLGRLARQALENSRKEIAKALGAKPSEIIFTSSSTEGANLAILGVARQYPNCRVLASSIEHDSVLACLQKLDEEGRFTGTIPVVSSGIVDPESVVAAVDDMTALVCVMYVNNEIGSIQPIVKISQKIAEIRADRLERGITMPLYLYCDAAQAGRLSLAVSRLGVDLLSMGGSKIYGPRGSGFLYVRSGVKLQPIIFGGGQESGLRSGTENIVGAIGIAEALKIEQSARIAEDKRLAALVLDTWQKITKSLPDAELNGEIKSRIGGNLSIYIPGIKGEDLVAHLDSAGFCVATGSACTAADEEPSHVLKVIGRTPREAEASLRITMGRQTTKTEVTNFTKALVKSVGRLRQISDK